MTAQWSAERHTRQTPAATMITTLRLVELSECERQIDRCERLAGQWNSPLFDLYSNLREHYTQMRDRIESEIGQLSISAAEEKS